MVTAASGPSPTTGLPDGTVTFLFTDLEGSTRLWEEQPEAMRPAMAAHDAILRLAVLAHGGRVVKSTGDGLHAAFARAADAVAAALETQRALVAEDWGTLGAQRVRVGVHAGVAELRDGDYYGAAVNRAARVMSAAHGGQVLLSQSAASLIGDDLPDGISLRDLGPHRLRDLQRPESLFQLLHGELPDCFPTVRSLDALPNNLPPQLTSLVGRERELAEVKRLVGASRLVTLMGMGGAGKTRLALQTAADMVDEHADGVWFVDLAQVADAGLVSAAVLAAMGLRAPPGRTGPDAVVEQLRARALLIVLDNCEHVVAECARLAAALLLGCARTRILATSRERLDVPGETVWRVPALPTPDPASADQMGELLACEAVRLFAERARQAEPGFTLTTANAHAVGRVCRRLDGLPLAIELAAARVRVLPVEQIANRLEERLPAGGRGSSSQFDLLTGGGRTVQPRQQTLRALLDWSHDLLPEPERVLLRRLGVFGAGWTLAAAETICAGDGLEAHEVLDRLTGLVDKSLVVAESAHGEGRYRMLETLRRYALERLEASGEAAALRRAHLAYFRGLAEEAERGLRGADQATWCARALAEADNLHGALRNALELGEVADGLRLGGTLWRLWWDKGRIEEWRQLLDGLLAVPTTGDRAVVAARVGGLVAAGQLGVWRGDQARARARLDEALALAESIGDGVGAAYAMALASRLSRDGGDATGARVLGERAVTLFRAADDPWGLGLALYFLGLVREAEDTPAATALFEESLRRFGEAGSRWDAAMPLRGLGLVAYRAGDVTRADRLFADGLVLSRERGDSWSVAVALRMRGELALARGDADAARSYYAEALVAARALGNPRGLASAVAGLAGAAALVGRAADAAWLLGSVDAAVAAHGALVDVLDAGTGAQSLARVRAGLDEAAFAAAWAQGGATPIDQAAELAVALAADWPSRGG